ncbi:LysR family transcriptional regulator [Hymenobacter sp. BT664]|uniref:LysR family transcriptional regulator n=1 Tax=Hymenobacter montanus TaxID=2771359 RepID=A0A927BAU3_9BACT|nr:LysR family transcriptional regulator [Hymenobacter montanus]MBD2766774.1 LysR family transcriptional regulator [Hymenobacter montanus]
MLNLEWYRTFKAIYRQGSLTAAAQELFISQPNVSQHLASLESYMGTRLFERAGRRIAATEAGKLLYTQLVEPLEQLEKVERDFKKSALRLKPTLHIGVPHEFFSQVLAPRLHGLDFPINVTFGLTENLLAALEKGELHWVVATQKPNKYDVVFEELLTETLVLVAGPALDAAPLQAAVATHDLMAAEAWLLAQNWYAYGSDLALIRRFWRENFGKRPTLVPQLVIPDLNAIVAALSLGRGVSVVSDFLCADALHQKRLQQLWPEAAPAVNKLYVATSRVKAYPQEIARLTSLLKD